MRSEMSGRKTGTRPAPGYTADRRIEPTIAEAEARQRAERAAVQREIDAGKARRGRPVAPSANDTIADAHRRAVAGARAFDHALAVVGTIVESGAQTITRENVECAVLKATPAGRADLLDPAALTRALNEAVRRGDLVKGYGAAYHAPQLTGERILSITGPLR